MWLCWGSWVGMIILNYPGGPRIQSHVCFIRERRGRFESHTEKTVKSQACWSDVAGSQGTPTAPEAGRGEEQILPQNLWRECSPADTCFLGLLQQIATDWVTAGDKFVSQFWRLDGAREGVFLVFPSFWGLLAIPGVLWFCNCITPVSTSIVTHPFPLPMTVSKFSSYRYTSHWIRAMLIQYDLMLTWLHLRRHFFYIRLHSQVLGVRTWLHLFGKCSSTHNRVYGWLPQWLRIWEQRNYLRLVQSAKDDSFWIWDSLGDRADKNWR